MAPYRTINDIAAFFGNPDGTRRLASESNQWKCYKCGLVKDLLPALRSNGSAKSSNNYAEQIRKLHKFKVKTEKEVAEQSRAAASDAPGAGDSSRSVDENGDASAPGGNACEAAKSNVKNPDLEASGEISVGSESAVIASASSSERDEGREGEIDLEVYEGDTSSNLFTSAENASGDVDGANTTQDGDKAGDDLILSILAVAIVVAIIAILTRKVLRQLEVV